MYGLKDEDIRKINEIFKGFPEIGQVILYGSRAKGNYKNGSDIDLTIKGCNLKVLNQISFKLDDLYLPYTFDLSVFENIDSQSLLDHIERVGVVFFENPNLNSTEYKKI